MKGSLLLGQFGKVKVFVHWTFSILLVYILFAGISAGLSPTAIGWHMLFIIFVFAFILLHEFGHVFVGSKFGFKTKDIVLLPIGGLARFEKLPDTPKEEILISIAGPTVNFIVAFILSFFVQTDIETIQSLDVSSVNASNFLFLLLVFNLLLGLFNLIPAFPMDGGRVFRALLSIYVKRAKATQIASIVGSVFAFFFILVGIFYNPFLILIGLFIMFSATTESSIVNVMELLEGHIAGELVMHQFDSLNKDMTVSEASEVILDSPSICFAVSSSQEEIVGTLSRDQIVESFKSKELNTPLSKIMTPLSHIISSHTPLKELYTHEILRKNDFVPVTEGEQIIGMINLENIMEFVAFKKAKPEWWNLIKENRST